jgi:hypothetical protein
MTHTYALDYESYYDKEISITTLGGWGYVFHPEADAYLISIAGTDGLRYVGSPKNAPWEQLNGGIWLAHNYAFDGIVMKRQREEGTIPAHVQPSEEHCTADMTAYLGYPRSLKAASLHLLGLTLSKDTRDSMKGKRWESMTPEFRNEVEQYALSDADNCLALWTKHSAKWPEHERRLSRLTREQGWRGVRIDTDRVERGIQSMKRLIFGAEQKIPWLEYGHPALSYKRLVLECEKHGIPAPESVAIGDEGCEAWEEEHGRTYPWVGAMRIKRRCNALLKKLQTILRRVREDGTMPFGLKYMGAGVTGRWSGDSGVNLQNLSRDEQFGETWWNEEGSLVLDDSFKPEEGVNLRNCLIAREGHHFLIVDLSQIEPRVSAVMCGDFTSVRLMAAGQSPYDAHAVATGMCSEAELPLKKTSLERYTLAKARELSLGYASGHHKFLQMAPIYVSEAEAKRIFSAPVTDEQKEAYVAYLARVKKATWTAMYRRADDAGKTRLINSWLIVEDFRAKKPKTVGMWRKLATLLESAVGDDLHLNLPSGRQLHYFALAKNEDGEISAAMPDFGKMMRYKVYGGALWNNIVQGVARDVFGACLLRVDDAGLWTAWSCHDEAIIEAPLDVPVELAVEIMSEAPKWMPNLPVASEGTASLFYCK